MMLSGMPLPLSMTSMSMTSIRRSSSTPDMHGQPGGLGMPDGVAEGFFDDGFCVIGQGGVDHRWRAAELHRGVQLRSGEAGDRLVEALAQPVMPQDPPCSSKIAARMSGITCCRSSTAAVRRCCTSGTCAPRTVPCSARRRRVAGLTRDRNRDRREP
jgi:hypothetical protein